MMATDLIQRTNTLPMRRRILRRGSQPCEPYHLDSDQLTATRFYHEQLQPLFTAQLLTIKLDQCPAVSRAGQSDQAI